MVNTPDPYHELETKYIFGFTEGADIGAEGEKSIEFETTTASGLRGGTYAALEQEVEFEGVPTQNFGYELSAHGLAVSSNDVPGMPDAHGTNFSGLSAEFRYLIIGRGPGSPVGLTRGRRAGMGPYRRRRATDHRLQYDVQRDPRHGTHSEPALCGDEHLLHP